MSPVPSSASAVGALLLPLLALGSGDGAEREGARPDPSVAAADTTVRSGPMVGYSTMREVELWAQTEGPAAVHAVYWDTTTPDRRFSTDTVRTGDGAAHVARLRAAPLEPGRTYRYEIHVDGRRVERPYSLRFQTLELWQWRRDPPSFRMALGSCAYVNESRYDRPGDPYGGGYEIFHAIHEQRPDAMLWLGDNTYLREADWNSRTGILHRYSHTRALEELQPLLASTHHYAIWDDHDYGPDNSDRSFWNKELTLEAFRLFWANPCPDGIPGVGGTACTFRWSDVRFFMLDNRWHRAPNRRNTGPKPMLGDAQIEWLVDALRSSRATFNVVAVGSQVLNPVHDTENYSRYPAERKRLLDRIRQEDIGGVVFVTGDRHFTEVSRLDRPGTYPLYEFTISPLTASVDEEAVDEPNFLRVDGTLVAERNFAIMEVTGPREDRVMTITIHDRAGRELWSRSLRAAELR